MCLTDSIERVFFKDEDSNSINHETLWRQDHDHGILQERGLPRFQKTKEVALRTWNRLNILVGNNKW